MSQVLPPSVRTYKPRKGRVTHRQRRGLERGAQFLLDPEQTLDEQWRPQQPIVLELGFGTGEATAAMATADPDTAILAIDVHTPGVGDLLSLILEHDLTNVRVIEGDALAVLETAIADESLAGIRSYFPDPWPKARHHKRRLVQPAVVELVATKVRPGGTWELATDWTEYADVMLDVFAKSPSWEGGVIPKPPHRPMTRYERRGIAAGRTIVDLRMMKVTPPAQRR